MGIIIMLQSQQVLLLGLLVIGKKPGLEMVLNLMEKHVPQACPGQLLVLPDAIAKGISWWQKKTYSIPYTLTASTLNNPDQTCVEEGELYIENCPKQKFLVETTKIWRK